MERTYDFYTTDKETGRRQPHPEASEAPLFVLPEGWESMTKDELDRWATIEAAVRRSQDRTPPRGAMCRVAGCVEGHEHVAAEPKGEWPVSTMPTGSGSDRRPKPGFKALGTVSTYHDYEQAAERVTYYDGEPLVEEVPVTEEEYPTSWDRAAIDIEVRPSPREQRLAGARERLQDRLVRVAERIIKAELDATIV